ncbi:MAG: hypothetical protein AAGJ08_01885 [Cyanobacteria bacterium P01_H01_bin.35]
MLTTANIITEIDNSDLKTWFDNAVGSTPLPAGITGVIFLQEIIDAYSKGQTTYNAGVSTGDPTVSTVSAPNVQTTATNEDDGTLTKTESWTVVFKQVFTTSAYSDTTGVQSGA